MNFSIFRRLLPCLALVLTAAAQAANVLPSNDGKKLADRYALTKERIQELLGARLNPMPMPAADLPNPFYRPLPPSENPQAQVLPQPEAADLTDDATLAKFAPTLKLGGYLVQDGVPHVTINGAICKAGDTITVGPKERPVFLHIASVTPQEIVLSLHEASYKLPIKK